MPTIKQYPVKTFQWNQLKAPSPSQSKEHQNSLVKGLIQIKMKDNIQFSPNILVWKWFWKEMSFT